MKKVFKIIIISLLYVLSLNFSSFATDLNLTSMSFSINLNEYDTEYTVANINGSIFVPLEKISQHMNLTLEENKQTKSIEIINGDTVISFFADKKEAQVNSNTVLLKNPPFILNNDFYIPIRFLIESLEGEVSWECNSFYPNGHIHIFQREYLESVGQFNKEGYDQIRKYLDLIDESSVRNVTEEEWRQVLSEKALKSGYGKNARVSRINGMEIAIESFL
ncbi:copper amine oxidase N-terminal domain-containing protein [Dethiothermospora halolimnae]|uniref:copper amine oxidase N-terminal domain-containing protein n=1 Tax=Dethiothermospora halolimnae TaxID=3114390 RepID=UPI003CCBA462